MIYLQYHSFCHPNFSEKPTKYHIMPSTFEAHVEEISVNNNATITFDDGSKSFYEVAFPILKKYNLSAIVFIDTEGIGKKRMNPDQLKEISEYGIEVQSHSHSHRNHFLLSDDQIQNEGLRSKDIIYAITGKDVNKYAFPHSPYSLRMCEILNNLGYKSFFTSDYGTKTKKYNYSLSQRINIYKDKNLEYFLRADKIAINRLKIELSKFRLKFSKKY